ncbi:MAG TPA: DUF5995 family protein [Anaerolineales bacterium]|nr:DUF5995 family protein [Anaerolineales bacterium]
MPCYLVSFFTENPEHPEAFRSFRARRIELLHGRNGRAVALFHPEAGTVETPDEVHIYEFPSTDDRRAFREDAAAPWIADLQARAVAALVEVDSGVLIPVETLEPTALSQHMPPAVLPSETLSEQLLSNVPVGSRTALHPAQAQTLLETYTQGTGSPTLSELNRLLQKWEQTGDRRIIFAHTYALMTANMQRAQERGSFHDKGWVSLLLNAFAARYFDALRLFESAPFSTPPIWRVAFDVAGNDQAFVVQHLLLGVNAHINYDLTISLTMVLKAEWAGLDEAQRQQRYEDHTRVNEVIAATFDEAQDLVIARYAPRLDRLMQSTREFDGLLVSALITSWREQAWEHAVAWLEAENWDAQQAVFARAEYIALRRADMIMLRQGPMKMKILF